MVESFHYYSITMTDMLNGTYEASYLISAGAGRVEATVYRITGNGINGKYYALDNFLGSFTTQTDF